MNFLGNPVWCEFALRCESSDRDCGRCGFFNPDKARISCESVIGQKDAGEQEAWTREKILAEAKKNVCGQREQDYGSPEDSFGTIAELWTAYTGYTFQPGDVAVMMALLKVARLSNSPNHMDSWVDLAGYAACGGEICGGKKDE